MAKITLDTNIIVLAVRDSPIWENLKRKYNLSYENTFVSVVSKAELKSLAQQWNWGETKKMLMESILENATIIPIEADALLDAYSRIDTYSQKTNKDYQYPFGFTPRNMGKNDLWIAATASMTDSTLLSTDKDFEHLNGIFLDFVYIDLENE